MLQRWCDTHPCGWENSGAKQVSSWHPNDYAVELVDDDATLTHLSADASGGPCLSFTLMAKIAAETKVFLELDFLDDGVVEFSERIPASDWELRTFDIHTPAWYEGLRFTIRKQSSGQAIVAQLRAEYTTTCKVAPLALLNGPLGLDCKDDEQCASGICINDVCAACGSEDDCEAGQICGATLAQVAPGQPLRQTRECVAPRGRELGDICASDEDCLGSHCADGVCALCASDRDCPDGMRCEVPTAAQKFGSLGWPKQCAPTLMQGKSGSPCVEGTDCVSGTCLSSTAQCPGSGCNLPPRGPVWCSTPCTRWKVSVGTCQ